MLKWDLLQAKDCQRVWIQNEKWSITYLCEGSMNSTCHQKKQWLLATARKFLVGYLVCSFKIVSLYILTKVNLKIGLEYCYYISILCAWELGQQTQYMFQGERKGKFQKCLLCDYWKSYSTLHKVLQAIDV